MDISPQQIRTAEFSTTRKGLDPDEVRDFLERVAGELERSQNQSTAMEARARAAVARLQELSEGAAAQAPEPAPEPAPESTTLVGPAEAETISRTLLLAQRTADSTIADAEAEAARLTTDAAAKAAEVTAAAEAEATSVVDAARTAAEQLVAEARDEARTAGEQERQAVASEVEALTARREFLVSDVEHLERFLVDQRSRLREAASALVDLTERVAGGMGEVRRPLLSASDDASGPGVTPDVAPPTRPVEPAAEQPDASTDEGEGESDGEVTLDIELPALDRDAVAETPRLPGDSGPNDGAGFFVRTDIADDDR